MESVSSTMAARWRSTAGARSSPDLIRARPRIHPCRFYVPGAVSKHYVRSWTNLSLGLIVAPFRRKCQRTMGEDESHPGVIEHFRKIIRIESLYEPAAP